MTPAFIKLSANDNIRLKSFCLLTSVTIWTASGDVTFSTPLSQPASSIDESSKRTDATMLYLLLNILATKVRFYFQIAKENSPFVGNTPAYHTKSVSVLTHFLLFICSLNRLFDAARRVGSRSGELRMNSGSPLAYSPTSKDCRS